MSQSMKPLHIIYEKRNVADLKLYLITDEK